MEIEYFMRVNESSLRLLRHEKRFLQKRFQSRQISKITGFLLSARKTPGRAERLTRSGAMQVHMVPNTKHKCKYKDKMLEIQMQIQREDGGIPLGSDSMARSPPPSVAITSHSLGTK